MNIRLFGGRLASLAALLCGLAVLASPSPANASTPKGAPLLIGAMTEEQTASPNFSPQVTLSNWQRYINAHGGLSGHPVKVIVKDDEADPGKAQADAQSLIQSHVLAIIDDDDLDSDWASAATAAGIPVICGTQAAEGYTCQSNANFFPAGTTLLASLYGNVAAAKQSGAKSFTVVYCTETPSCSQAVTLFKGFAQNLGLSYPSPLAASSTAPNYTAQCVQLDSEHAQAVFPAGPPSNLMATDCAEQGYKPIFTQSVGTWQTSFVNNKSLNGTAGDLGNIPWFLNTPATKEFDQVMGKYMQQTKVTVLPYWVASTWAAAQLFATAAKDLGTAEPSTAAIYSGLYAASGTTLGGFSPPLDFVKGKASTVDCYYVIEVKSGKFTAPSGSKYTCAPASALP